jgi:hypothetical protein
LKIFLIFFGEWGVEKRGLEINPFLFPHPAVLAFFVSLNVSSTTLCTPPVTLGVTFPPQTEPFFWYRELNFSGRELFFLGRELFFWYRELNFSGRELIF